MVTPAATAARTASEPGVVERAVAEVLHEVPVVGERGQPDPLGALAAHLGQAQLVAAAGAVQRDHGVAADAHADQGVVGRPGWRCCAGSRSRSTGCGRRSAAGRSGSGGCGVEQLQPGRGGAPAAGPGRSARPARGPRPRCDSAPLAVSSGRPRLVVPADHERGARPAVERVLQLGLQERGLVLDDQHLLQVAGQLGQPRRRRPGTACRSGSAAPRARPARPRPRPRSSSARSTTA